LINLFSPATPDRDLYDNWNSLAAGDPLRTADATATWFQTQLLKLYFLTTLYVDVKEPAVHVHFRPQKNSILRPTWTRVCSAIASAETAPMNTSGQNWAPICSPSCT